MKPQCECPHRVSQAADGVHDGHRPVCHRIERVVSGFEPKIRGRVEGKGQGSATLTVSRRPPTA